MFFTPKNPVEYEQELQAEDLEFKKLESAVKADDTGDILFNLLVADLSIDVNARSMIGNNTVLYVVVGLPNKAAHLKILLENGADVTYKRVPSDTVLMRAIAAPFHKDSILYCQSLIDYGANPNCVGSSLANPLIMLNTIEMINYLHKEFVPGKGLVLSAAGTELLRALDGYTPKATAFDERSNEKLSILDLDFLLKEVIMQTEDIEYTGDIKMRGFLARSQSATAQPVVIIAHDWSGCRDFAQDKAKYFAEHGYVGFAVDMYGVDKRGSDTDKGLNQSLMQPLMQDRQLIISRLQAAMDCIKKLPNIKTDKIIVLGFCFGGLCALDFARSGAEIAGAVSVHGLLFKPEVTSKAKIKAKILALHGYNDQMSTPEVLDQFHAEMTSRGADWQTHIFGHTTHAFTNPKAHDPHAGLEYHGMSNTRAWAIIKLFVDEIFG